MNKDNLKRVKNILAGKYTNTTKTFVSKSIQKEVHNEGDKWEDNNGKTWTIEHGIKKSISKLKTARDKYKMPLTCPRCNKIMKTYADKKIYHFRHVCIECATKDDTDKVIDGTYKSFQSDTIKNNINTYLQDFKSKIDDYIEDYDSNTFIAENGDIEDWETDMSKERLKELLYSQYDKLEENLKK